MDFDSNSDRAIREELAQRLRDARLNRNLTQATLAERAGVARSVVQNLEAGKDATITSFIRLLRSLGELGHLNAFLPDPGISPLQLARMQGRRRRRATGRRGQER